MLFEDCDAALIAQRSQLAQRNRGWDPLRRRRLNPLSQVQLVAIELPRSLLALVARQAPVRKYRRAVFRDAPNLRAMSRMLFPCRFRTRISTAFSATSMRAP